MGPRVRAACMPKNLYKRGKTWWGRVQVAGREYRKSLRTRDRAVAKVRFATWHEDLVGQAHFGEHRPTWDEALLRYVQDVMPGQVKPSTAERYLTSFRQVHHLLKGQYLDGIGKKELFAVVSRKGPTNATRRRDFTAVAAVLNAASSWGWLDQNPVQTFDLKVVRERRDPIVLPEHHENSETRRQLSIGHAEPIGQSSLANRDEIGRGGVIGMESSPPVPQRNSAWKN